MYRKENESWKITISSDYSLNFALFTGFLYGLIEDNGLENIKLWPQKSWSNKTTEDLALLKKQWKEWFNTLLNDRGEKVILKQELYFESNMFNPPDFTEFPYDELGELCKSAWQPFIKWWEMIGGGRNALSYIEGLDNSTVHKYISEFENIVQRKVKPFNLYIDLVYTGSSKIVEVNDEYIVMVPVGTIYSDKAWWMNKLREIG